MKYILEIPDNKMAFAEEFFKSISFVKNARAVPPNEITNPTILQSIEAYENNHNLATPLSLSELKEMIDA